MTNIAFTVIGLLGLLATPGRAEEGLVGRWQMISQKLGPNTLKPLPVAIRIGQASPTTITFQYVSGREEKIDMEFTVKLDGTGAPIRNGAGSQIGTASLTKAAGKYQLVLQSGSGKPEPGTLVLSEKGQILTCESDINLPEGRTRIQQVFSRL